MTPSTSRASEDAGGLGRLPWPMLGMAASYALGWCLLWSVSHALWFLPAGLRLAALWLTPTRRWPWLAAGEWAAAIGLTLAGGSYNFDSVFVLTSLLPWVIYAAAVLVLRGSKHQPRVDDPRRMAFLLGSGLLSAALVSPLLQRFLHGTTVDTGGLAGTFSFLYGDFLGQLVVAPLLVLIAVGDWRRSLSRALWLDVVLQLLVSAGVFWLIRERSDLAPYLLLLAFAPIFFVAFRQGWQGAAISVALVGLLIQGMLELGYMPVDMRVLQLALAVVGSGGLVLGAASSELRRSHERLAARHRELGILNSSLNDAAAELRKVSQRLVRLEEQGQRELAGELDYELGQSIHALSTRISLAFRDVRDEQMLRLLESVREQVREMQDSLRRVLRQLRPQALDTHGLREAVGFGPLREMLEDAGIAFETAFQGRIEALSEDVQTSIYRICQAAVRDASQNPAIRRLLVRVEVKPAPMQRLEVHIRIDIDAAHFLDSPVEPTPLPAITDRVMAQQGSYWVESLSPGVSHRIRFEEVNAGSA